MTFMFFTPGMYGKTNLESTQIDQILETLTDMLSAALPGFREQDATKKVQTTRTIVSTLKELHDNRKHLHIYVCRMYITGKC